MSEGRYADLERWTGAIFVAACALLALIFYREFAFAPDRMLSGTDMLDQAVQLRKFAVEEVKAGRGIPLWNPFVFGGVPFLAILPGPLFYPTTLLYYVMPLHRAIGWTFVIHLLLAGAFGYFAGRSFGLGRGASVVCGLSFMFTGYTLSHVFGGHDGRMFAMVLIPLAFGLLERGLRSGGVGWFLGLGVVIALQILTPHVQIMYFSSLALVLYAVWSLVGIQRRARSEPRGARVVLRPALLIGLAFLVAAGLGAIQLIPTMALTEIGVRGAGAGGYEFASSWALPPQELTAFFLPDLIGSLPGRYWGANPFKLHTEYLGAATLALATLAVAAAITDGRKGQRSGLIVFLCGASILGVLFALGGATPVHRVAYAAVPMIKSFRGPAMMLGPVAFFVALLAGIGWQRAVEDGPGTSDAAARRVRWIWVWALSSPVLLLGLAAALNPSGLQQFAYTAWYPAGWPRLPTVEGAAALRTGGWILLIVWSLTLGVAMGVARGRLGAVAVIAVAVLIVTDLGRVDARYVSTVDPLEYYRADAAVETMQGGLEPGQRVWQLERSYGQNELMYHGVPSIDGSQNFRLSWFDRLVGGIGFENLLRRPLLWSVFDVTYLTTRSDVGETSALEPLLESDGVRLWRVTLDLPHAFFPPVIRPVSDEDEALRLALDLRDYAAEMVVETGSGGVAGAGSATIVEYLSDEIVLDVEAERAGLLFISEIYEPGWKATIDGEPVEVLRADAAFRAVHVPTGRHELRMAYRPASVSIGRVVSLLTLAGVLVGLGWVGWRRRRPDDAPSL